MPNMTGDRLASELMAIQIKKMVEDLEVPIDSRTAKKTPPDVLKHHLQIPAFDTRTWFRH
jgi:hypothetical protein